MSDSQNGEDAPRYRGPRQDGPWYEGVDFDVFTPLVPEGIMPAALLDVWVQGRPCMYSQNGTQHCVPPPRGLFKLGYRGTRAIEAALREEILSIDAAGNLKFGERFLCARFQPFLNEPWVQALRDELAPFLDAGHLVYVDEFMDRLPAWLMPDQRCIASPLAVEAGNFQHFEYQSPLSRKYQSDLIMPLIGFWLYVCARGPVAHIKREI